MKYHAWRKWGTSISIFIFPLKCPVMAMFVFCFATWKTHIMLLAVLLFLLRCKEGKTSILLSPFFYVKVPLVLTKSIKNIVSLNCQSSDFVWKVKRWTLKVPFKQFCDSVAFLNTWIRNLYLTKTITLFQRVCSQSFGICPCYCYSRETCSE